MQAAELSMHQAGVQSLLLLQLHRPDVALPVADGEVELIAEDVERRSVHLTKRIGEVKNSPLLVTVDWKLPDGRGTVRLANGTVKMT